MDPIDEVLKRTPQPRIAMLVSSEGGEVASRVTDAHPGVAITAVDVDWPGWKVWGRLAGTGPLDLLIDATGRSAGEGACFVAFFQHLTDGGNYFVPARSATDAGDPSGGIRETLARLADGTAPVNKKAGAVADALDAVSEVDAGLVIQRKGHALAKMREAEMNAAFRIDPTRGRVLDSIDGVTLESRAELRDSGERHPRMPDSFECPKLFLREYFDVHCGTQGVVTQRNLVPPDTFRHHKQRALTTLLLEDLDARFVRPPSMADETRLEGSFYHLDNEHRGHFGHLLTEQVSRLWGWQQAKEADPSLRLLLMVNPKHPFASWERFLLGCGGVEASDIVVADDSVRVERMVSASPMWSMPYYVHPRLLETWDSIGGRLLALAPKDDYPRRIFVGRRNRRGCTNSAEVEELFTSRGFVVVYPEEHSQPVQAALFHHAEVVGGYLGSGMFSVMWSDRPKHLIAIGGSSYMATNEYMIAAVRGHKIDRVTCQSRLSHPEEGGRSKQAKNSRFTCDMTREGAWLRNVLEELPD